MLKFIFDLTKFVFKFILILAVGVVIAANIESKWHSEMFMLCYMCYGLLIFLLWSTIEDEKKIKLI